MFTLSQLLLLQAVGALRNSATPTDSDEQQVHFMTVQTNPEGPLVSSSGFPATVTNLGEGKQYHGHVSKVKWMSAWLEDKQTHGDDLVVFFDGADVAWGGCSRSEFLERYAAIAPASGPRVVVGAEVNCWKQRCDLAPAAPTWAQGLWSDQTICPGTWTEACGREQSCAGLGCSHTMSAEFLNSGFYMGPASALLELLPKVLTWMEETGQTDSDQRAFAHFWLERPDLVTLDYGSRLVLNLAHIKHETIEVRNEDDSVAVRFHDQTACFVHGNGAGKELSKKLAKDVGQDAGDDQWTSPPSLTQQAMEGAGWWEAFLSHAAATRVPKSASRQWLLQSL